MERANERDHHALPDFGPPSSTAASFLFPVSTTSNTMVMEQAGYRFPDYWPLGLSLTQLCFVGRADDLAILETASPARHPPRMAALI